MNVDPISDFLTRIRNGQAMQHEFVSMPSSRIKIELARVLFEEGFIAGYREHEVNTHVELAVDLKYDRHGKPVIDHLKLISKRGRREYAGWRDIRWVRSGLGIRIVTTPKGIMTGQQARRQKLGGEVICEVW